MRRLSLDQLGRPSAEEYRARPKLPVSLVLDGIRSLLNVGSLFRTADAFLVEKIFLVGITGRPPHREIEKTALGATRSVAWEYFAAAPPLIDRLRADGWALWVVEQTDESIPLPQWSIGPSERVALVLGNEVYGVSDPFLTAADGAIEIPQFGTKHSLNVAVAGGIVLYHTLLQMHPDFAGGNG